MASDTTTAGSNGQGDYFAIAQPSDIHPSVVSAWQSGQTGKVVAVREIVPRCKYMVETYPENYYEDKDPIETVARVHSTYGNAEARARRYMSNGQ